MSNFIDFLLVISKLQSPIYCRYPQENDIVLVEACVVIHTFIGKARLSAPDWRRWSS